MANFKVLIVHLNIVVYAFCFWIVDPLMPYILKDLGGSQTSLGYFKSYFNLVQLAGGLVVGLLQDRYSGAMALSLTQLGSFMVYSSYAFATSIEWLYVSRLLTVLQQSMQVAQAYVSKACVTNEERSISMGRLTLSYGIGMVLGGMCGGYLLKVLPSNTEDGNVLGPIILGSLLSLVMAMLNLVFLDRVSLKKDVSEAAIEAKENPKQHNYWTLLKQLKFMVIFFLLLSGTRSMYEPVFTMTLVDTFQIPRTTLGQTMSYFAIIGLFSNVVLMPALLSRSDGTKVMNIFPFGGGISEVKLIRFSIIFGALAYGAIAVGAAATSWQYFGFMTILTLCSSMLYTLVTSFISSTTPKSVHGQTVAMSHALRSAVGTIAPLIGSEIHARYGGNTVAGANVVMLLLALGVLSFRP